MTASEARSLVKESVVCKEMSLYNDIDSKIREEATRNADIIPVDLDTVSEYTGTKDCAGTSIFEGDVLEVENEYGTEYCYVFYDNNCGNWKLGFPDGEAILLGEYLDDPDTKVYTNMWEVQDILQRDGDSE